VLSVRQTMHRSAFLGNTGKLHVAAMAAPPSPPSTPASHSLPLPLSSNHGRPSLDQRIETLHTPSRVLFLKESLDFW
jgi:hypothetical protein